MIIGRNAICVPISILDPMEDQYAKRKDAKKERIAKNEYQRLRNIAKTTKGGGRHFGW